MTGAAGALCNCSSDLEKSLKLSSALELKTGVRSGKVGKGIKFRKEVWKILG